MAKKPVFVNLLHTPVSVYDEANYRLLVLPWEQRGKKPEGLYRVEGEHYAQFVSARGPLFPFPKRRVRTASSAPAVGAIAAPVAQLPPAVLPPAPVPAPPAEEEEPIRDLFDEEIESADKITFGSTDTDWFKVEKGTDVIAVWRNNAYRGIFVAACEGQRKGKLRIQLQGDDKYYREVPAEHVELIL